METQLPRIEPMPLKRFHEPFSSRDWFFELKYDGFRALAEIESGRCRLVSRNGNAFASFHELALRIGRLFPKNRVVMDGEIVCVDKHGRPQFKNLLFRRGEPSFVAFDLLYDAGKDLRHEQLVDRKTELRRVLSHVPRAEPLLYAHHIDGYGEALFQRVCELDLEGIESLRLARGSCSKRRTLAIGRMFSGESQVVTTFCPAATLVGLCRASAIVANDAAHLKGSS